MSCKLLFSSRPKPTYGLVSRFGLIPYANSLEQIGPIGKTVSDVVMIMKTIAGADDNDQTVQVTYRTPDYNFSSNEKMRIGLVRELTEGAEPEISKRIILPWIFLPIWTAK